MLPVFFTASAMFSLSFTNLSHSSLFPCLTCSIHPSCCVVSFHPSGQGSQLQPPSLLSPSSSLSPCSEARVTQFIRQFVASCLLVSDTNTELSYVLPSEAVKKGCFERLFQVHKHRRPQKHLVLFFCYWINSENKCIKNISNRLISNLKTGTFTFSSILEYGRAY